MNQATAVANTIPITKVGTYDGVHWIQTEVYGLDFHKYNALPHVINYMGKVYRKMSFNTDNGTVSYKESNQYATGA